MHFSFAVLPGLADTTALSKEVHAQLNTPSNVHAESLFELFHFIQSTFSEEENLYAKANRAL